MTTLYVSSFSLLTLLFEYIDILFPDKLETFYRGEFSSTIRFSIASLIIIFPIYLILTKILNKDIRKNSFKKIFGFAMADLLYAFYSGRFYNC